MYLCVCFFVCFVLFCQKYKIIRSKYANILSFHFIQLLLEYVGGGSLSEQLIENGPLPIEILRQYSIELLEVLSYLHGKAVVHKDLKASSVFVGGNGRLKIADYSLCKRYCFDI